MARSAAEIRERISALIQQIACAVVLGDEGASATTKAGLEEVLQSLADLGSAGSPVASAAVLQALDAMDSGGGKALADAIERLSSAWDAPEAPAAPVPTAPPEPVEDELVTLQSDPELATMFITEALDHLGSIEACALQLESTPEDTTLLNDVFRPFHTVKGNAGALGVTSVQEVAHKVENLLDLARSGKHRIGRAGIDVVLRAVDLLTAMLRDLSSRLAGDQVVDRLNERRRLMADVEALILTGEPADGDTPPVMEVRAEEPRIEEARPPASDAIPNPKRHDDGAGWVKVDTRKLDNLVDMVGELVTVQSIIQEDPALLRLVDERLGRNLGQLKRITSDLQRNAMSMRMVPIRQTFQKMGRLVRDLSRKSGKQVDLALSGEDTELDRRVVEDINDPLMHMVRNSMDHGLETPEARQQQGKPVVGRLSLSAYHQGGNIVIAIADDGAGLNTERIRSKAIAQGLLDPSAQVSTAEIHHLIFAPGFSTAEKVTEISGRGVGMDVVRRNIDALRGRIEIQSEPGRGTTFLIKLPLTLAIVEGLLLGVGAERFVLPTFSVCESLRPMPEHVHTVAGEARMIRVRQNLLPLVRLSELFAVPGAVQEPTEATVVVIEDSGRRVAVLVDRLLGKQEVVIKTLGEALTNVRGVAGGAILGDGRIGLILDAQGLVKLKDGAAAAA